MREQLEQTISEIDSLKENLVKEATSSSFMMNDATYKQSRVSLLTNSRVKGLLPEFPRQVRNRAEFYTFISGKFESSRQRTEFIREAFEPALASLEEELFGDVRASIESAKFLSAGSDHDAFVEIRKMIKTAATEVLIVDPYVDETLWLLLGNLDKATRVRILTNHMKGDFVVEAQKFAKQHGNKVEIRSTASYHDRFVIIDSKRCWHLGASIQGCGCESIPHLRIDEPHCNIGGHCRHFNGLVDIEPGAVGLIR